MKTEKSKFGIKEIEFDPEFQKMIRLPLSGPHYIIVDKNIPDEEVIKKWWEEFKKKYER